MQRYSVASSNLASVGYDTPTQTLEVEFLSGSVYQYYNVPENIYEQLMHAGSKGRFFHQYIRNAYPYSRIG
ncbi:MAG: KTSC domain-containing protein [Chloroflexi bacterium]|nr:KTSC domain-containing protein [Chloroflexota bacterium]